MAQLRFDLGSNSRPTATLIRFSMLMICGVLTIVTCRAGDQEEARDKAKPAKEAAQNQDQHSAHLPLPSREEIKKLPKDGGPEFNRLVFESSPYLLQHARNAVDWYPWGPEAFAKAKREGKAVFLSVGYSTCHWCHVMERESFENQKVADLLNEHFVSIKVDREERPDVDNIYMAAVQAQTGRGGWPMSVFMTPDRKPFWGGTYFPPEDSRGRPGFKSIITQLSAAYKNQRKQVLARADKITVQLQAMTASPEKAKLDASTITKSLDRYQTLFDAERGGFGRAPKFPRSHGLSFLLRIHQRTQDARAISMVKTTLDHMSRGGIQDHLGGGFHRYSTDAKWLVPHFEKMLYDQALLARTYLEAFQVTADAQYAQTARDIFHYVLRDMTDDEGGFYSAEDADSEGEEGKFYVWTRQEILRHLGQVDGELFCKVYNVSKIGNFKDETTGKLMAANILHLQRPIAQLAAELAAKPTTKSKTPDSRAAFKARLKSWRDRLFAVREKRIHPLKDDKILTDWNGLMISALAYGGQALGDERYTQAAVRAATFNTKTMIRDGRLLHRYRQGDASIKGYLDDYAFLCLGLLDLYETTFDAQWLGLADRLAKEMIRLFWDDKTAAFHFSGRDAEGLITKTKEVNDGAVPSGNSVATLVLLRLGRLTTNSKFTKAADDTLDHYSGNLAPNPMAYPFMLMALDFSVGPSREIVLAGPAESSGLIAMKKAVHRRFIPNKVLAFHSSDTRAAKAIEGLVPFIKEQGSIDGKATAYVCENYACQLPSNDLEKLIELLMPPAVQK
ncbi:MAG: thioredoxin domain-containing protein [Planctomycetota bacterium]